MGNQVAIEPVLPAFLVPRSTPTQSVVKWLITLDKVTEEHLSRISTVSKVEDEDHSKNTHSECPS